MNKVNDKLNELIDLINSQKEVIEFNRLEAYLKDNEYINLKLNEFRKMQQKHVLYETKNGKVPDDVNAKYEQLLDELLDIPVFNEYINLQNEINDVIQTVSGIIETEMNASFNRIEE